MAHARRLAVAQRGYDLKAMSLWRHMANLSVLVGARLGGAALGLLVQLVLTRLFARDNVGLVLLAMSVTAVMSLVMTAGYPALSIAYLARYHSLGRKRLVRAFNSAARKEAAIASIAALAVVALVIAVLPIPKSIVDATFYGCLAAIPYAIVRLNSSGANAIKRYALSYVPDFVFRPLLLLIAMAAFALWSLPFPIAWVLWAYVAITVAVAVYQSIVLGRESVTSLTRLGAGDRLIRPYRRRAWSLALVALVTLTFADLVTVLAGWFLPPSEVAVVGIAIRLAALVGFVTQASQQFVMRDLTAAMAQGDSAETKSLLLRTNLTSIAIMAAAFLAAAVFGELALSAFGAEYRAGHLPLMLFMLGQMLRAASGMNTHLLSLDGHQVRSAGMCVIAVVVLVAASVVLCPAWGALGIACAAFIAELVWAIMLTVLTQKLTGRRGDVVYLLRTRNPA
jgi:O-antigen/teichoic acid export membrane protein